MKKSLKMYAVIWAILLAAFNLVVFLVRPVIPGYEINYDVRFWVAWALIIASFIGNLICAYFAFRAENSKKLFYRLTLPAISWTAMIVTMIVGCALMLIPNCTAWIAAVICIIILAFNTIAVINAGWAADVVEDVDEKVKIRTSFIQNLAVEAEVLVARAKSEAVRTECKKVYEAVHYSDPMSNDALSVIEAKITVKVDEFASVVGADNAEKAKEIADEIVILVADRNKECKALK